MIIPVPLLTPRLSSHWINLVTALPYGLARPLVDSLINDVVVSPERDIRRFIDHQPYTLDEAISRALAVVGDRSIKHQLDGQRARSGAGLADATRPGLGGRHRVPGRPAGRRPRLTAIGLFATVSGIGGARGWYVANPLWALRGLLDKLIGGVGHAARQTTPR